MPITVILANSQIEATELFHAFVRKLYKDNSEFLIEKTVEAANMLIMNGERVIFTTYFMLPEFELNPNVIRFIDGSEVII